MDSFSSATWQAWWRLHREEFLDLAWDDRRQAAGSGERSSSAASSSGRVPASPALIDDTLLPVLLDLAQGSANSTPLRSSSLLAAARLATTGWGLGEAERLERQAKLEFVLRDALPDSSKNVQEAAILGLGMVQSPEALQLLSEIALDLKEGREALEDNRVPLRARALATYALGLGIHRSGDPALRELAAATLETILSGPDARQDDLGTAAVLGLGLLPVVIEPVTEGQPSEATQSLDALAARLLERLHDKHGKLDQQIRIPTALARLAPGLNADLRSEVVLQLTELLGARRGHSHPLRRAAALALGQLGDADGDALDARIRRTLVAALKSKDGMTRRYGAMSLARVASRKGDQGSDPWAGTKQVASALRRHLTRGRSADEPWTALALGVFAHRMEAADEPSHGMDKVLAKLLGSSRSTDRAPAFAIAAGLAGTGDASAAILKRLEKTGDDSISGLLGLALGFTGDLSGLPALRAVSADSHHRPDRRARVALGRAILGDELLVPELVEQLTECSCWNSLRGSAQALARVGDVSAIGPLLQVVQDPDRDDRQRREAVQAIGWIASGESQPWSTPLTVALDPLGAPDTLTEPTGFGVLDRL